MSAVAGNSQVTVSVSGNVPAYGAPTFSTIQALISQSLNDSGWLQVLSANYQAPGILDLLNSGSLFGYAYTATLTVLLLPSADGTDSSDIASAVSDAFANATGNAPNGVSIPTIKTPTGGNVATGQPGQAPQPNSGGWLDALTKPFTDLENYLKGLGTTVLVVVALLLIALAFILAPHAEGIGRGAALAAAA